MPGSVSSLIPPVVDRCTFCRRQQPVYDVAYSLGNYEQDLREAILKCKSGHHDGLVMALSRILAAAVPGEDLDFVVPMPIHWRRRLGRVTVVSELMASEISLVLGIPVVRALRCRRLTQKQGRLSTRERIKNMRRAFECRIRAAKIHQKNILLVDDVMTSGATSNEAAWELRRAGAETVQVAILARGIGRSSR